LCLAHVLQSLDVNHFLAQLTLATGLGVVLDASEFSSVLEQLSQRLCSQFLILIRLHVLVSILVRLIGVGLAALR
jgi:hypothetical protein